MFLILTAAAAVSLSGCGGGASQDGQETTQAANGDVAGAAETAAASSEDVQDILKQPEGWTEADATESITYMSSSTIITLDKWSTSAGDTTFMYNYMVFDGLFNKDENQETVPWLAESWEMADDNSSITIHLRDGVYFTNGEKLTADDAIFSFERIRDDTEHLPDSVAKGWRDYLGTLEKVDDLTFVMNFKNPMPEFWTMANIPDTQILNKKAFEETDYDTFWMAPVGTGAYVVEDFDGANSCLELALRTDEHGYWGYDYMDTYTNVSHVTFAYSPESTTRVSALRTGEADIINNVPTMDIPSLKAEGYTVEQLPPSTQIFLLLACSPENILYNRDLREALSLCIDRDLIVSALLEGYAIPLKSMTVEGDLGYRSELAYEYDVEKAKELVASSGYNGETLKLIYSSSTVSIAPELSQALQSMFAEAGINVEVVSLETAIYDEARANRDYDLCIASIGKSGNMWFKTGAEVIGNDRFNTGHTNQELKNLAEELSVEMNEDRKDEIFAEMNKIQLTSFEPNLYLYCSLIQIGSRPEIYGIRYHKNLDLSALVVTGK